MGNFTTAVGEQVPLVASRLLDPSLCHAWSHGAKISLVIFCVCSPKAGWRLSMWLMGEGAGLFEMWLVLHVVAVHIMILTTCADTGFL